MSANLPRRWRRKGMLAALAGTALVSLGCTLGADVVAYDLPAESARYTLAVDADGVHTEWEYTSSRPTENTAHELQPCMAEFWGLEPSPQPCRPEPLIFLRYDLDLGLDNTLPAGRSETVRITGFYQQLESPPEVTELMLEVSFDGGDTWQQVGTRPAGDSSFTATIRNPRLSETDGVASLRVTATDDAGNTVEQTIPHAYGLR